MTAKIRRCKNCSKWDKRSNKFGKCPVIGRAENLRFAYREGVIFAMTPQFGVCNQHTFENEEKPLTNTNTDETES